MLEDLHTATAAVRRAVEQELVEAGCPAQVARRLAERVTVELHDGIRLVCLLGTCVSPEDDAAARLAEGMATDNA